SSSWRSRGSWGGAGLGGQGEGQRPAVDGRGALVGDRDGGGEAGVPGVHGVGDLAGAGGGCDGGGGGGAAAGVEAEEADGLGGHAAPGQVVSGALDADGFDGGSAAG